LAKKSELQFDINLMNQPLLSVIVPCYNVEQYLDKCVSSIVAQTYSNLEILLIDDGSPDRCGIFCDEWQERDSRVRVIHKQNEGLAYARKTGVENATGEYITFVDADDWIDPEMYADMMMALLSTNSEIAQCGVYLAHEDGSLERRNHEQKTNTFEIIGRVESVLLILENKKWRSWMWNKIFKKHLLNNIKFLKGNGYAEDFVSMYAFHNSNQSVYLHKEYYFYLQRSDSISYDIKNIQRALKNHIDFFEAWKDRYYFVQLHPEYHSALPNLKFWVLVLGLCLLRNIIVYPRYFADNYFHETAKQLRSISLLSNDKLRGSLKIEFYLLKISTKLYKMLRLSYVMIIKIINKLKITCNRRTDCLLSEGGIWFKLKEGNAI